VCRIKKYIKLISIWESDNGREYGWYLKINNIIVAEFVDAIGFDIFWDSYSIIPIKNLHQSEIMLDDPIFWQNIYAKNFSVENKIIKYKTSRVIFSFDPSTKRVSVRSLYIPSRKPTLFDYFFAIFLNFAYKKVSPSYFNRING